MILKPSSLGDVIHAIPVLRLLKQHMPAAEIYWWLDTGLVPLLEKDRDLTGIFPFPRKRWGNAHRWPEIISSVGAMRAKKFDWAIDLQGLARSAFFGWVANPGVLYGFDNLREGAREGARGFYDRFPARSQEGTHAVDRYLSILPLLGVPVHWNFEWLPQQPEVMAKVQTKWHPDSSKWIMLLPGARWNNKRWPVQYFTETVKKLEKLPDVRFGILGGSDDKELGKTIAQVSPKRCLDLTGQTNLREMIEWIRLSHLTISNDTGPMHVAAALNKPVIALFGPTDPKLTGPYRQLENVIQTNTVSCVPCLKSQCRNQKCMACLHAITPDVVANKAELFFK